jgi:hypothetical protein
MPWLSLAGAGGMLYCFRAGYCVLIGPAGDYWTWEVRQTLHGATLASGTSPERHLAGYVAISTAFRLGSWSKLMPDASVDKPRVFADLVATYVLKWESEKVRHNTADDFALGPDFLFCAGRHGLNPAGKSDWQTAYVKLTEAARAEWTPRMCEASIGSFVLRRAGDDKTIRAEVRDRLSIACIITEPIVEIPDDLLRLV